MKEVERLGGEVTYDSANSWLASSFPGLFSPVIEVYLDDFTASKSGIDVIQAVATDRDVAYIVSACPTLVRLNLDSTQVTDNIIDVLLECEQLRSVSLCNTGVTERGLRRLRARLPHCAARIYHHIQTQVDSRDPMDGYYLDLIVE